MDDRQREHNKRQVQRNRLRQHMRVLEILTALPPPAGLGFVSGVELALTRAFSCWSRIDWACVDVDCEVTRNFNSGAKNIKRRDAESPQAGLIPSGLSKKERIEWYARHSRTASNSSIVSPGQCADIGLPELASQLDRDALAALDSASATAADQVLSRRVAQREARAAQRTLRKQLQVESFAVVLHSIIQVMSPVATTAFKLYIRSRSISGARSFRSEQGTHCGGFRQWKRQHGPNPRRCTSCSVACPPAALTHFRPLPSLASSALSCSFFRRCGHECRVAEAASATRGCNSSDKCFLCVLSD